MRGVRIPGHLTTELDKTKRWAAEIFAAWGLAIEVSVLVRDESIRDAEGGGQ
jgi:hypothetical protein